ncbi:Aryl-phospho-beta-D-glucosidase BglC, GH1 family [Thermomonospora echinospora]|uniref:Aryl-phospho-beta-D-glucosidase BglC, GH1 family n=1 Tax=Thermomonospora echinospora TaxID=1992 RepID=A0A1H6CP04_9ACTN|nr:cellulase family glycosylhydrolase [Thermomonospora echinospora]SEG74423.1 Aryl-phospho-beta-D-glucosidase BglC, GH1 family [Thermomonospora echinospora]
MTDDQRFLRVSGDRLVDGSGAVVRLRGVGVGGWLNMENFITGYPATETLMRRAVRDVLGDERYRRFFDRLLTAFFDERDAAFLASLGLNCVRLPFNYRHFEDDLAPFTILEEGFAHLDRVIDACARHGVYSVLDLHAAPGAQNHHWHSDNATHLPAFWEHVHFQDRLVHLWQVIADRYADNPWVAGYNLLNEPADPTGEIIGPFYARLVKAVREVDPRHTLFLDGNTYSTRFDMFGDPWENTVYTCHDYALAGFVYGGDYPGYTEGEWVDRDQLAAKFLERSEYQRRTGTPIWVGEFGPVYTGDPARDAQRYQILRDQLDLYDAHGAGWSLWTYKDVGLQGLVHLDPQSPYARRFGDFQAKKARLGADHWGSTDEGIRQLTEPIHAFMDEEFPGFDPYPFGRRKYTEDLVRHILFAQPLTVEYADLFRGLDDTELDALADSFALPACIRRDQLTAILTDHCKHSGSEDTPARAETM